ncbi:MAG: hypothetical protein ACRC33_15140 [Gemmataceae bacterium]
MAPRRLIAALALFAALGCGGGVPREKLDQAQQAVTKALDGWKSGQKPAGFTDPALRAGAKLLGYQILRTEADREGVIRTFARLTLRDRRGKEAPAQAAYMVKLDTPPVVSNDPMF